MVGIIAKKLLVERVTFNSTHGHPTEGTIYCFDNWVLYFRFRGSQFKIVVEKAPGFIANETDKVLCMKYLFLAENVNIYDIVSLTLDIFDWHYFISKELNAVRASKPIKPTHCIVCNEDPKIVEFHGMYCPRCQQVVNLLMLAENPI